MPLYLYRCERCGSERELVRPYDSEVICCDLPMSKVPQPLAFIRIKGKGYPSRRKWMDNWTPDSLKFPTASVHGEKY